MGLERPALPFVVVVVVLSVLGRFLVLFITRSLFDDRDVLDDPGRGNEAIDDCLGGGRAVAAVAVAVTGDSSR